MNNRSFKAIRYWPTWVGLGVLWLIGNLPYRMQLSLGWCLGQVLYYFPNNRREVARINLELCFPEMSKAEREHLLQQTLRENMIGIVLANRVWFNDVRCLGEYINIEGIEHIEDALKQNKGVLWVGLHFATLEFACGVVARFTDYECSALFRNFRNELFDTVIKKKRFRYFKNLIERAEMRRVIRLLKSQGLIWYAPDQDYGLKHSVFAPFFNIPTATITATMRLAKLESCAVIISRYHRTKNGGYTIAFQPALQDFPSGDDVQDATRLNKEFESAIRENPAQYVWVHRRFKTRPPGEESPYKALNIRNKIGRKINKKRFDFLTSSQLNQLLKGSVAKPSVLQAQSGEIYKIFWPRDPWPKFYWSPAWIFYRNSKKLFHHDVLCPMPTALVYYPETHTHVAVYPKLPGVTLREKLVEDDNHQALKLLPTYLADLHGKGILFNAIDLSHVLIDRQNQLSLLSIERIRFTTVPLTKAARIDNLQHLFSNQKDNKIFLAYGIEKFINEYLLASDIENDDTQLFTRLTDTRQSIGKQ